MATHVNPRVLIVEDEPLVRLAAADQLSDGGFTVLEAGSAEEALLILEHGTVDVLFTDIDMPGAIDGLDLGRIAAARWPSLALVVTSGRHPLPDAALPERSVYLPKPYRAAQLTSIMGEQARH